MLSIVVPAQAWAILKRHAHEEVAPLRLQELCRDEDRTTALIEVYQTEYSVLIVDLSRQRMTDMTINHLLGLAVSMNLNRFIQQIAWGRNDPWTAMESSAMENGAEQALPQHARSELVAGTVRRGTAEQHSARDPSSIMIPSMHLAMRVPPDKGYEMFDGNKSILPEIHTSWERVESFAQSVRTGQLRGATGLILKTVLVIGASPIPMAALRFLYTALQHDSVASRQQNAAGDRIRILTGSHFNRQLRFIDRVDPQQMASVLEDIDPASTLVVTIAVTGKEDTGLATKLIKGWLLQGLKNHRTEVSKHMILVTGNERIASVIHKPESVFVLPEYARCEAFLACSVATCLPLAITFGWSVVKDILAGAHDMDKHFVETNPRHNLPVLLALTDIWNDVLFGTNRCLKAGSFALNDYSKYVAALEASTCREPSSVRSSTAPLACDAEATAATNCEWVFAIDNQIGFTASKLGGPLNVIYDAQDSLVCDILSTIDDRALESNQPSAMLWCGRLSAFCCGQLLALSEHRSVVKAHIWGVDPFLWPPERRIDYMNDYLRMVAQSENGEDDDRLPLATRTILSHYVSLVREKRLPKEEY